jgi:HlyD family secretion protein
MAGYIADRSVGGISGRMLAHLPMKYWPKPSLRAVIGIAALVAVGIWWLFSSGGTIQYVTAKVTRGSIVRSVTATGTVNPVITVQVGSYVSGPIVALYADFNSPVKSGQLIAKIDPKPFEVKVAEAQAAVANAKAQVGKDRANLAYQKVTYERDQKLVKENVISQDQLDSQRSTYQQAVAQVALDEANIQQQEANLRDAQVNLDYTNIVSPVDGTVVSRNVDVGQTVAASFQTPTLFLIAKDLTKMQVDANVSESDIGGVSIGQHATFKVDAFPDRDFDGVIGQVRQAPITVQNVVTYDVVVNVDNPELLLKPGMTANVTIVTAKRDDAIRIPMDALRFAPRGSRAPALTGAQDQHGPGRHTQVWTVSGGSLQAVPVAVGLDDGTWAEMLSGSLQPGDQVVTDEIRTGSKSASQTGPQGSMLHLPR